MARRLSILCLALLILAASATAKEIYVPDYFPCPKGGEWNYKINSSNGVTMDMRRLVTEVSKLDKGGYKVVINSYSPTETINTYLKVAGWVYTDKAVTPSVSYTFDYEKDCNELMNPLATGKTWSYKGTAGGMSITQDWKCVGVEAVKVPAGEFKSAIKVTSTSDMGGNASKYTFWYVDRVGMVKSITEAGGVTSTTELVSYKFPK